MARTFIGELVLRLKDQMSGEAKKAASNLDTSVDRIQRAARRMNQTTWGGQFEERLRKLGTSSVEIDRLRKAWDSLHTSMSSRNLSKALQSFEKSNFKTAALAEFSNIAVGAKDADTKVRGLTSALKEMVKYGAAGGLLYGGMGALRGGINASAELQREIFKQDNARIPKADQLRIASEADRLTTKYPSAGLVNVMELARSASTMMGSTARGLAVLEEMTKGMVALQTAKNPEVATEQLRNLLRGIDNAGKNSAGDIGIKDTRAIIAGMIRAAQIEDGDIDVGKLFQFARRGKIAVPGLSTEFLANIQPALSQDMTPEGFGTALSSAYQAFVIGSNAVASKKNVQRQEDIGIRDGKGLVQSDLFGTNPYAWVKTVLVPALKKQGVDTENETAVAKEVAQLTRNTNASGLLTRMITQQQQIDRLLEQYKNAVGTDSANDALARDPFVAWKGFVESWRELATSIKGMPEAVAGLNMLTGGIQRFSTALREKDGGAQALLAGAGVGAAFAGWKVTAGVWGLATAGTNLNAAAFALEAAAVSLGAGGAVDGLTGGKGSWSSKLKDAMPWLYAASQSKGNLGALGYMAGVGALAYLFPNTDARKPPPKMYDQGGDANSANYRRIWGSSVTDAGAWEGGRHRAGSGFGPSAGMYQSAIAEARHAGAEIQNALDVTARPSVDNAALVETIRLANQAKAAISGIGQAASTVRDAIARKMNLNFADHGVSP